MDGGGTRVVQWRSLGGCSGRHGDVRIGLTESYAKTLYCEYNEEPGLVLQISFQNFWGARGQSAGAAQISNQH
jgi:hypothetical protein